MEKININNIVATASISDKLNLELINELIPNSEYNKKRFPGLIYRQKMPKTALLIFSSGKVVCTGAKTMKEAKIAILNVIDLLSKFKIHLNKKPDIFVQNIVATSSLHAELNLSTIAISLGLENVEYEPEQFPGLVYRVIDPKVVFLICQKACPHHRSIDRWLARGCKQPLRRSRFSKNFMVSRVH